MPLDDLWPPFPKDSILHEDEDLIAIEKPAGISTHAPDAARSDDAVSRLALALAERDGVRPDQVYLGIHQRLDQDTSGVLVFTRRKSANPQVAREFEGRHVEKVYVAGVVGWPAHNRTGELRHWLVAAEGGRLRPAKDKREQKRGQEAITEYRVLRRVGERSLLELRPRTGRTHQLRVQVAALGARIAGDRLYEGTPASRLMLHAASLSLKHPSTGRPVTIRAKVPEVFESWLQKGGADPFATAASIEGRLREAAQDRWALGRAPKPVAFRLVNDAGDELPGVAVDVYGEHLLVHLYSPEAELHRASLVEAAAALGARGVYVKVHPKQSNTLVDTRVESLAPKEAQKGESAPDPLVIAEEGLLFGVRLGDGLKTGIFLDQRENRRIVRRLAEGKRVLNLFAYTCGFTVAAAAGSALSTVSVDASAGVLEWGRENLERNGLGGAHHQFVTVDVFAWLKAQRRKAERYDLVILDPPSYATTKKSRFSAESDYPALAAEVLALLSPGGRLLACTNHRGITRAKFRRALHQAGRDAGSVLAQVKDLPDPQGFPRPFWRRTASEELAHHRRERYSPLNAKKYEKKYEK